MGTAKAKKIWAPAMAALAAAAAAAVLLQPDDREAALASMPARAVATGVHYGVRGSWREQVRAPVVAKVLAAYDVDAAKVVRDPGVVWTMRLAVGDLVVSALVPEGGGYAVAAASPARRRGFLLRLLLAARWVPGLGRLQAAGDGTRYADVSSRDSASPLYLSLGMRGNVLLAKLSSAGPADFSDMLEGSPASAPAAAPEGAAHRFAIRRHVLQDAGLPGLGGDAVLAVSRPGGDIRADLSLRFDEEGAASLRAFARHRLSGRNATASALAGDHAVAMLLLPSRLLSPLVRDLVRCGKGAPSDEDAALYITTSPYGARLYAFELPAATACVPGLALDEAAFQAALKAYLPKALRAHFALCDETAVCSSKASLREQRHARPAAGRTWKDAFREIAGERPCAFLYLDVDPLARELAQVAAALKTLGSFGALSLPPGERRALAAVARGLPLAPTGTALSAALLGDGADGSIRLRLALSLK